MSIRVLDSLVFKDTTLIQRATDDLESFIWVLIWAILGTPWAQGKDRITSEEQARYKFFRSTSLAELHVFKSSFFDALMNDRFPTMAAFRDLLAGWFEHTSSTQRDMRILKTEPFVPLEFYTPIYAKYLSIGFGALNNLPDHWNF
ncbi:MAG TPA: hypothetical protein VGO47_09140 [Chlamydiales bacterium]|nr:hypothetical protein [Chlamydiales bacterium]